MKNGQLGDLTLGFPGLDKFAQLIALDSLKFVGKLQLAGDGPGQYISLKFGNGFCFDIYIHYLICLGLKQRDSRH